MRLGESKYRGNQSDRIYPKNNGKLKKHREKIKKTTNLTIDSARNVINLSHYNFWKATYKLVNKNLNSAVTEKKF